MYIGVNPAKKHKNLGGMTFLKILRGSGNVDLKYDIFLKFFSLHCRVNLHGLYQYVCFEILLRGRASQTEMLGIIGIEPRTAKPLPLSYNLVPSLYQYVSFDLIHFPIKLVIITIIKHEFVCVDSLSKLHV